MAGLNERAFLPNNRPVRVRGTTIGMILDSVGGVNGGDDDVVNRAKNGLRDGDEGKEIGGI